MKMFLLMSAALLPFGMIALLASIQASRAADGMRRADLRVAVSEASRKLAIELAADTAILRGAAEAGAVPGGGRVACFRVDMTFAARAATRPRYALFKPDGTLACATPGFAPSAAAVGSANAAPQVVVTNTGITIEIMRAPGRGVAFLDYPASALAALVQPIGLGDISSVIVSDSRGEIALQKSAVANLSPIDRFSAPVGLSGLSLQIAAQRAPFTAAEALQAFLPLLMWAAAVLVAFIVTDRLLIFPLSRLRTALIALQPGSRLTMPRLRTPAREIRELAESFEAAGETIAAFEASMAKALADQVRLTREVHHRVKNNLQVVASLISLHARGVPPGPVADAYASIQRRVDAIAIVHRNHFAELEENHGISAKALIGELAANLRNGLAAAGQAPPLTIAVAALHVSQDVAVPIAFLVTELVELSISDDRQAAIAIALHSVENGRATLSIASAALGRIGERPDGETPRYSRVIDGLARQLRSPLTFDAAAQAYTITVAVLIDE